MDILIIALIIVQTLIIIALLKNISGKSNGKNDEKLESIAQDIASAKEELRKTASFFPLLLPEMFFKSAIIINV